MRKFKPFKYSDHPLMLAVVPVLLTAGLAAFAALYRDHETRQRMTGRIEGRLDHAAAEGVSVVLDDGNEAKEVFALPRGSASFRFDDVRSGKHSLQVRRHDLVLSTEDIVVQGDAIARLDLRAPGIEQQPAPPPVVIGQEVIVIPRVPAVESAQPALPRAVPATAEEKRPSAEGRAPTAQGERRTPKNQPRHSTKAPFNPGGESTPDNLPAAEPKPATIEIPLPQCSSIEARAPARVDPVAGMQAEEYRDRGHIYTAGLQCKAAWNHVATGWSVVLGVREWECECRP